MKDLFDSVFKDPVLEMTLEGAEELPAQTYKGYVGSFFSLKPLEGHPLLLVIMYSEKELLTGLGIATDEDIFIIDDSLKTHREIYPAVKHALALHRTFNK